MPRQIENKKKVKKNNDNPRRAGVDPKEDDATRDPNVDTATQTKRARTMKAACQRPSAEPEPPSMFK